MNDLSDAKAENIEELKKLYNSLSNDIKLHDAEWRIDDLIDDGQSFNKDAEQIEWRQYVFGKDLRVKVNTYIERCNAIKPKIENILEEQSAKLKTEFDDLQKIYDEFEDELTDSEVSDKIIEKLERGIKRLREKINAVEDQFAKHTDKIDDARFQLTFYIRAIKDMLDLKDQASFKFKDEHLLHINEAEWVATGKSKQDPDGMLYLTDKRLIFEQKETTGKTLGLFGGKKVHELKWEVALEAIDTVSAEFKSGFWDNTHIVHIKSKNSSTDKDIIIRIKNGWSCEVWADQIRRMMKNDLASFQRAAYEEAGIKEY